MSKKHMSKSMLDAIDKGLIPARAFPVKAEGHYRVDRMGLKNGQPIYSPILPLAELRAWCSKNGYALLD